MRELITSVKELNKAGTETIWTAYSYDALKQIVQVVSYNRILCTSMS